MTLQRFIIMIMLTPTFIQCSDIEIKPIQAHQVEDARNIIIRSIYDLQMIPCDNFEELKKDYATNGILDDLYNIENIYTSKNGIFLVMTNNEIVIGMGAIKYLDQETCELKRMYFDPQYQGKGHGGQMLE